MAKTKEDTKTAKTKEDAKSADTKEKTKASAKTKSNPKDETGTKAKAKTSDKKEETKAKADDKSQSGTSNNQIVESHDDGWAVRKEGSDRATEVFDTRVAAVERARELVAGSNGDVFIYREGGPAEA